MTHSQRRTKVMLGISIGIWVNQDGDAAAVQAGGATQVVLIQMNINILRHHF
jgi:hypothetical protein